MLGSLDTHVKLWEGSGSVPIERTERNEMNIKKSCDCIGCYTFVAISFSFLSLSVSDICIVKI